MSEAILIKNSRPVDSKEPISTSSNLITSGAVFTALENLNDKLSAEATVTSAGLMSAEDKSKLDNDVVTGPDNSVVDNVVLFADTTGKVVKDSGYTINEILNQSAFSNIQVAVVTDDGEIANVANGSIEASDSTDALTLAAGKNITIEAVNSSNTIIINSNDENTTYEDATQSASGLMSAADKAKLDNVAEFATNVSYERAVINGIKIGTITINGITTDIYMPEFNEATQSTAGLMSAADKAKLDNIEENATRTVITYGTEDLVVGVSELEPGSLHIVYEVE